MRGCPCLAVDPTLHSVLGPNDRGELKACHMASDTVPWVICVLRKSYPPPGSLSGKTLSYLTLLRGSVIMSATAPCQVWQCAVFLYRAGASGVR
jgi:hypothetical protein